MRDGCSRRARPGAAKRKKCRLHVTVLPLTPGGEDRSGEGGRGLGSSPDRCARGGGAGAESVGEIGDASAAEDLLKLLLDREKPEGVRDTCAFALAKLKYSPAIAELASALSDPGPSVRLCVTAALAAIRNPVVRERAEQTLAIESDTAVRVAMTHLLDLLLRGSLQKRKLKCTLPPSLR